MEDHNQVSHGDVTKLPEESMLNTDMMEKHQDSENSKYEKEANFGWRDIVLAVGYLPAQLFVAFLVTIVGMFYLLLKNKSGTIDMSPDGSAFLTIGIVATALAGLACFVYILLAYKNFLHTEWARFKESMLKNIGIIVGFYFISIVLGAIITQLLHVETSGNQKTIESMFMDTGVLQYTFLFFSIVIFAPLVEEMLMRKVFIGNTFKSNNKWFTIGMIFLSGILFGMLHFSGIRNLQDFLELLPYMCMGWVFGIGYAWTKNIFIPVGVHALNNFVGIIIIILTHLWQ